VDTSPEFDAAIVRLREGRHTEEDIKIMMAALDQEAEENKAPEPASYPLVITVDHKNVACLNGDRIGEFNTDFSQEKVAGWVVDGLTEILREKFGWR
jgi:hypothetical protein